MNDFRYVFASTCLWCGLRKIPASRIRCFSQSEQHCEAGHCVPHCIPPTSRSKRSSLRNFSISGQGKRRRRRRRAGGGRGGRQQPAPPGPTAKVLPKASGEGSHGKGRAPGSESSLAPEAANRLHTPSPPGAEVMTNSKCDGRTRSPRLHDSTRRAARGSPGPSPARLASRLLRSRHPRSSAPASVQGLGRSEAAGSRLVALSGGACGPPLPLLPRWPRAPLLRGEPRWRRLWLCEEDGRGGGVGKAASKKSQGFSGGQRRSESPGKCYLTGFGCFKREERSGASCCSGWARYKGGKHGGGGLRRRRRGKAALRRSWWRPERVCEPSRTSLERRAGRLRSAARSLSGLLGGRARSAWTIAPGRRRREKAAARGSDPGAGHASGGAAPRRPAVALRSRSSPFAAARLFWTLSLGHSGGAPGRHDDRHPTAGEGLHAQRGPAVGRPGYWPCVLRLRGEAEGHVPARQGGERRFSSSRVQNKS